MAPDREILPQLLWEEQRGPEGLADVAAKLIGSLGREPFRLWLIGDLGAGKTTLTGRVLHALGLSEKVPVTSPTYTYMNEYQIDGVWYAHLDLYRADGGLYADELGLAGGRHYHGLFIEWPENVEDDPLLAPTHRLDIAFSPDGQSRIYRLRRASA